MRLTYVLITALAVTLAVPATLHAACLCAMTAEEARTRRPRTERDRIFIGTVLDADTMAGTRGKSVQFVMAGDMSVRRELLALSRTLEVMMSKPARALSVAVLAGALAFLPDSSGAQERRRFALTPGIDVMFPGSYYAREFDAERSSGEVRIRQKTLPLLTAQLSYELPGTRWRIGLGFGRGESDLKVYHYLRESGPDPGNGLPPSSSERTTRYREPATREVLTLSATRQVISGPVAVELMSAVLHQTLDATIYQGFFNTQRIEGTYSDWGTQLGASVGPGSGWARGLRIGGRMRLLRTSPEMYDVFRSSTAEPEADADFETALVASLTWSVAF